MTGAKAERELHQENDITSVFISRVPLTWKDDDLAKHFEDAFGKVTEAHVNMFRDSEDSRGFGFVTFESESSKAAALESLVLKGKLSKDEVTEYNSKVAQENSEENEAEQTERPKVPIHRTFSIKIIEIDRENNTLGRGRDTEGICHLFQRGICPRTDDECKFRHLGEGGTSIPGTGKSRKKCFAFMKNKCQAGKSCPFLHIDTQSKEEGKQEKQCLTWKKKGKCSKGEGCKYAHDQVVAEKLKKRKRAAEKSLIKMKKLK